MQAVKYIFHMAIFERDPLNFVTHSRYEDEKSKRYALGDLETDKQYKARLIMNRLNVVKHAADFLVVVNEIILPKKRLLSYGSRIIRASLSPVDPDGNVSPEKKIVPVWPDGILYTREPNFMTKVQLEAGYFLSRKDERDDELEELLALASPPSTDILLTPALQTA